MSVKRIQIILPNGDPQGIKVIEVGKLKLKGFSIPRTLISEAKIFDDLHKPCLYVLGQRDGQSIYIGEAENFFERISDHLRKKDFWELAIVFVGGLDKVEVKYLESVAVHEAKQAERYEIHNAQTSKAPHLDMFREDELRDYFSEIKLLISFLGYPVFEEIRLKEVQEEKIWYCSFKKNRATAIDDGSSFTILKGSLIDPDERKSIKESFSQKRQGLLSQKATLRNGVYILNENITFQSANQAGQFCLGGHANAWTTWKNKEGKTMDEVLRQNL